MDVDSVAALTKGLDALGGLEHIFCIGFLSVEIVDRESMILDANAAVPLRERVLVEASLANFVVSLEREDSADPALLLHALHVNEVERVRA